MEEKRVCSLFVVLLAVIVLVCSVFIGQRLFNSETSNLAADVNNKNVSELDLESVLDIPKYAEYTRIPPHQWSVNDVESWMNMTIGYPEYSTIIRAHRIDGLTLLEMESCDFELYFPLSSPLHAIKIKAHLKVLHDQYEEPTNRGSWNGNVEEDDEEEDEYGYNSNSKYYKSGNRRNNKYSNRIQHRRKKIAKHVNFWQYLRQHNRRTWIEGVTTLFFSRTGMLMSFLFDRDVYRYFTTSHEHTKLYSHDSSKIFDEPIANNLESGTEVKASTNEYARKVHLHNSVRGKQSVRQTSVIRTLVFWIAFLIAPDFYMAYHTASLIPANYITMTLFTLHFLHQAYCEYLLIVMWYKGTAFEPNTTFFDKIWGVFSFVLLFPFIAVIVTFVFPFILQYLVVAALQINNMMLLLGMVLLKVVDFKASYDNKSEGCDSNKSSEGNSHNAASDSNTESNANESQRTSAENTSKEKHNEYKCVNGVTSNKKSREIESEKL